MRKATIIVILTLLLSGCFWNSKDPNLTVRNSISHPDRPAPVQPYDFDWHVITDSYELQEDDVFVALDYEDSLQFRQFLEDVKRYTREANSIMCFYRKDLEEEFCLQGEE